MQRIWVACVLSLLPLCTLAQLTVDGHLNEEQWSAAQAHTDFRTMQPLLLDAPAYATRARVLSSSEGLAIGIECMEPSALRVRGRSARDAQVMDADTISVMVDFDGSGSSAYEFTVSLSGSMRDGVIVQQNRSQYTWDGIWYSAVREHDTGWDVELLLPWSIAPLGPIENGRRTVGLFFTRELKARGQRFSFPPIPLQSPSFVGDFHRMSVEAYESRLLSLIPYGSVSHDLLDERTQVRGGADLIWQPSADQQLTATLKPDFAQVENDDLVVNFTAVEPYLPDKRPFFTQNQQLFDLRMAQDDRLINTRRIGAAPDAGPAGSSDVLGAVKYLRTWSGFELGTFAATEDDSADAAGRTFAATRLRWKGDGWSAGYLGTYTDRPSLSRDVVVHSTDAEWSPGSGWRLGAQLATTRPSQRAPGVLETRSGYAGVAKLEYAGAAPVTHSAYLTWYDAHYDPNDLGFMERNNLRELWSQTRWYFRRQYPLHSRLLEMQWYLDTRLRTDASGELLPSSVQVGPFWKYRDGSSLLFYVRPTTSGLDDLSTRGGGSFLAPPQHEMRLSFLSDPSRTFQYFWYAKALREGLERYAWEAQFKPTWLVTEDLKLALTTTFRRSPDWLIWRTDAQRMVRHERRLLQGAFSGEWFPNARSELRVRLQWTGLRAEAREAYDVNARQRLARSDFRSQDFSRGEFAFQIRLRYELQPLSDLYIAFNSGGLVLDDEVQTFGQLWDAASKADLARQVMIKVTYRL